MLEVRDLKKIYSSKKSSDTVALDGISLKFPDTGLIFILGKSGSGKSTLLNLLGGLDSFDEGEIIINDVSSKNFSDNDFDSYRNTYLGFIFQEFNILEGFSIGKNIDLALRLQDVNSDREKVEKILKMVDLEGFYDRKPNELSGGQKQRVAIARALIKDPSVIFADEPTGALDSTTGRQVFDTLKKLSDDKLIVVVSHDRDFAEEYADRIIELSDGQIVRDVTRDVTITDEKGAVEIIDDNIIKVTKGFHLTEADIVKINDIIDHMDENAYILTSKAEEISSCCPEKVRMYGSNEIVEKYVVTNQDGIVPTKPAKSMIKSKLPTTEAVKMAFSNFKAKKFRLILTVFLSVLSLVFFGFATMMSDYDKEASYAKTFYEGDVYAMNVHKVQTEKNMFAQSQIEKVNFTNKDLSFLNTVFNNNTYKVYDVEKFNGVSFVKENDNKLDTEVFEISSHPVFKPTGFTGIIETSSTSINPFGVAYGKLPVDENECAISDLFAEAFIKYGIRVKMANDEIVKLYSNNIDQVIGKTIIVGSREYVITGVFKTNYHTYKKQFEGLTIDEINSNSQLKRLAENYKEDEKLYMSKIMVANGYSTSYKDQLQSYDANMSVVIPNATGKALNSSIQVDSKYDVGQGEIYLSALYYRNLMYGVDSTRTFEQLEFDFNKEVTATLLANPYKQGDETTYGYQGNFKIVGIYDDIDILGAPTVLMNKNDFRKAVNELYQPNNLLVEGNLSGTDYKQVALKMHENGYEVEARSPSGLAFICGIMEQFVEAFYIISIVLAIFVTLLLFNFISASIANKRKEIGILRAIGARGVDVMKIFIFEGLIIAMIISLFAIPLVYVGTVFATEYMLALLPVVLVSFTIKQGLLMLGLTVVIIVLSSLFPVLAISKKKPIDAIREK